MLQTQPLLQPGAQPPPDTCGLHHGKTASWTTTQREMTTLVTSLPSFTQLCHLELGGNIFSEATQGPMRALPQLQSLIIRCCPSLPCSFVNIPMDDKGFPRFQPHGHSVCCGWTTLASPFGSLFGHKRDWSQIQACALTESSPIAPGCLCGARTRTYVASGIEYLYARAWGGKTSQTASGCHPITCLSATVLSSTGWLFPVWLVQLHILTSLLMRLGNFAPSPPKHINTGFAAVCQLVPVEMAWSCIAAAGHGTWGVVGHSVCYEAIRSWCSRTTSGWVISTGDWELITCPYKNADLCCVCDDFCDHHISISLVWGPIWPCTCLQWTKLISHMVKLDILSKGG